MICKIKKPDAPKTGAVKLRKGKKTFTARYQASKIKSLADHPFSTKSLLLDLLSSGYSMKQILRAVGISKSTYYKWLKGKVSNPKLQKYHRLLQLYCHKLVRQHESLK